MKTRLISAVIALIIFIPLIIIGNYPFSIGAVILSLLAFREIISLEEKDNKIPMLIKILGFLLVGTIVLSDEALIVSIMLTFIFIFIPIIFINSEEYNYNKAIKMFGTVIFTGLIFYLFCYIRNSSLDEFIYLALISTFTDTFAYIGGRIFGRHKLNQRVSPNKTIEGSVIGTIIGTLIPVLYYVFMIDPGINIPIIILITFILSIFGQLGDLLFSSIKRYYKVKDFSNIMPGHGGILDRLDSLSLVSITYIMIKLLFL